jgi:MinD superfamily P-loop ATPase
MIIAVASGKGGTGKTTLSVSLALASKEPVMLLDCDVEEPNDILFFNPVKKEIQDVTIAVPFIEADKCTGCGSCSIMCSYNAIVTISKKAIVFSDLCHSCGGCILVCPEKAIYEKQIKIGTITKALVDTVTLIQGELKIGNAMSPPIIRAVKHLIEKNTLTIIDSPPGTSCPMVTSVKGSDVVILVTEPTPFGLHDLKLAVKTIKKMNIPFGVIINRADSGDDRVENFCREENIDIFMRIRDDRRIAEACSRGGNLFTASEEYRIHITDLLTPELKKDNERNCNHQRKRRNRKNQHYCGICITYFEKSKSCICRLRR